LSPEGHCENKIVTFYRPHYSEIGLSSGHMLGSRISHFSVTKFTNYYAFA